ncbi:hypothetical protein H2198_001197 [Neophaeococcomyces mojaviensis]|uniref:Uncharacterized protein n=1 Tax=Neophaeococcomyces mojaviensis TaxID=3383035 RepID=A0ACC3AI97_9EURO|nr:hypothetical protein H2198_001197 [Knufia sp. JES_112]
MHPVILVYGILAIAALRLLYISISAIASPTRHIPGPFLARFSRLWYFRTVWTGEAEKHNIALHRKYAKNGQYYAPIVRLGPNMFSVIDPDKQVYGISSKMRKSDWYEGWKHPSPERWTLFPDRDIQRHNETRKKFQNIYSLSSLVSYEKYVDDCAAIFQDRLGDMATSGKFVDMGHWFQCYAFDVIGAITYSRRFGFLDKGEDVGGIIAALDANMSYSTLVGVYAWLHPYLYELLQRLPNSGAAGRQLLMKFAKDNKATKEAQRQAWDIEGKGVEEKEEGTPEDFLDKILDMKRDNQKGVTDYHCFIMTLSNIIAGSDTTAVSLSAILYHLIRTPSAMQKLREEIRKRTDEGACEAHRVSFKDSQNMPYLQACIKEGLRVHPAVGLPLWRTVNNGGVEISGEYLPAGSEVGINAWVSHNDQEVWGPDAHEFRPERWIEAESEGGERLKFLEAHYLPVSLPCQGDDPETDSTRQFGLGSRTCLGKHISYLEMTKLVPQIVRNFDFELQHPDVEWSCKNYWFVKPANFHVRVRRLEKHD